MAKKQKAEPNFSQEQPYDSSWKMLLDDQTLLLLSYLLGVLVAEAHELKESLFKKGLLKPSLRVDALYSVRNQGRTTFYLVHIEFETDPVKEEIEGRLIQYFGMLFHKYRQVIMQVLVSPFKGDNLPMPTLSLEHEGRQITKHEWMVVALSKRSAQELMDGQLVGLYALLPTMAGATYDMLVQALTDMEELYQGQEDRFRNHLLWFDAFLERTATVAQQDKERVRIDMGKHKSLLEEGFFYRQATEEARAKGLEAGRQEGRQETIITLIGLRFPELTPLAQQRVPSIIQREALDLLLKEIYDAPDEVTMRSVLEQHPAA